MTHVFISYVHENKEEVDALAKELTAAGIKVWLDRNDIAPGQDWREAIRKAIQNGMCFLACFSKESSKRLITYQNEELEQAIEQMRLRPYDSEWFIPVSFDENSVPNRIIGAGRELHHLQIVDLSIRLGSSKWKIAVGRLIENLQARLGMKPELIRKTRLKRRRLIIQTSLAGLIGLSCISTRVFFGRSISNFGILCIAMLLVSYLISMYLLSRTHIISGRVGMLPVMTVILVGVVSFVSGFSAISDLPLPLYIPLWQRVLNVWKIKRSALLHDKGFPTGDPVRINLWYQYYYRGLTMLNTWNHSVILLYFGSHIWRSVDYPDEMITESQTTKFDAELFDRLLGTNIQAAERQQYIDLLKQPDGPREPWLMGGPGTVYVREHLLAQFKRPLHHETQLHDAVLIKGSKYDLIVGMINSATDGPLQQTARVVFVLYADGKYDKDLINF